MKNRTKNIIIGLMILAAFWLFQYIMIDFIGWAYGVPCGQ
jgi:hypothetical protein